MKQTQERKVRNAARLSSLLALLVASSLLTRLVGPGASAQPSQAQAQASQESAAASSQPLWSYQIKPANYAGASGAQQAGAHYAPAPLPSLLDAFSNGLSQRQGALTTGPLMSILPILLIAAGGILLLLPMFTMMLAGGPFGAQAGPFGAVGPFGQGAFGYPQALSKRRSLPDQGRGIVELIEHFSSTIDELSRKYTPPAGAHQQQQQQQQQQQAGQLAQASQQPLKRSAKSLGDAPAPANHKPASESELSAGALGGGAAAAAA